MPKRNRVWVCAAVVVCALTMMTPLAWSQAQAEKNAEAAADKAAKVAITDPAARAAAGQSAKAVARARIELQACKLGEVEARCGRYEVFEDRAARKGRKIALRVAVIPAAGPARAKSAIFFLAGGPGQAATRLAGFAAEAMAGARAQREIVLVDQRGTGESNPLKCDVLGGNAQGTFTDLFPIERIRACRSELESRANLRLYTTPIAMDDLDEVRAALGYEQVDLYGTSYGTRAAQVYLRQYPKRVRSVILKGVVPMEVVIPTTFARTTERALELLLRDCAAAACAAAFPRLREELRVVTARFEAGPVQVMPAGSRSSQQPVSITRGAFLMTLGLMLQSPPAAAQIPMIIHRAYENDYAPLAQVVQLVTRSLGSELYVGMMLSVVCAEDDPVADYAKALAEAKGTVLGDYRIEQQRAACAFWPRGKVPAGYRQSVSSTVPVLLISGNLDPVTPPESAEQAGQHFSNRLTVVAAGGSHSFSGMLGCVDRIMTEFVQTASPKGIEVSCAEKIKRPEFVVPRN